MILIGTTTNHKPHQYTALKMNHDHFGRLQYSENDLCDLLLQKPENLTNLELYVDNSVDLEKLQQVDNLNFTLSKLQDLDMTLQEFDLQQQQNWFMPDSYQNLDIAEYILKKCQTQEQLQRCGQELLMFQERNLFNLLKYLKYLVDTMTENQIIWGLGRGSSVASYVLYLLGVHRIDSLYYQLDINEFLK
jgi:DNA polymerase III alpha subunit